MARSSWRGSGPDVASKDPRSDQARSYRHLYGTARWRAIRLGQLRDHPLCQRCLAAGFTIRATVCNHVDPKTKLSPATFYQGPFSSLCGTCHDGPVQSSERGKPNDRIGYSGAVDAAGWPIDSRHPAYRVR
jgi:5-methylcytosine-specific restriction protein A